MTDTKAGEQRTCMSVACRGIVIVDWTSACGSETVELLCGHCRECDRLQVYDERRKVSGKTGELAEEVDLSTCRVCECGVHYPNGMEPTGICHPCEIGELSARVAQLEAELKEAKADAGRAEEWAGLCDKLADALVEIRDGECNDRVHELARVALDLLP